MIPLYFGSRERRLFGIYTPGRADGRAIVLCHPWGQEYMRAHRSIRRLANLLTAGGHHVLRFDYYGTGDSAGDMSDATLAGWERDIEAAIDEVRETSNGGRIALVGLRLGAFMAARVSARQGSKIESLVLWDPVVRGADFIEEFSELETRQNRTGKLRRRPEASGGGIELLGFAMTQALKNEIEKIDLLPLLPSLPARTSVVTTASLKSYEPLRKSLKSVSSSEGEYAHLESVRAWRHNRDLGAGAVPVKVLEHIVERLR